MKKQPLFSILMANYNNKKYIAEAIKSIQSQTYKNWEIIIVDDKSTDNSLERILPFLKDKRIKLFKHTKNKGCGAAKKLCAQKSTGEYFGVLDPDDTLKKDAIEIMIKAYKQFPNCVLIYSTLYYCDNKLKPKYIASWVKEMPKGKTLISENVVSVFAAFKKSAYDKTKGFDPLQEKGVDKDSYLKIEEVGPVKHIPKPLYYYRENKSGISQFQNAPKAKVWCILARYKAYKRRIGTKIPNLTKKEMSNLLLKGFLTYKKNQMLIPAIPYLIKAIKTDPKIILREIKPFLSSLTSKAS